ncbi:hypothetical protein SCHPADRAFT_936449 [Schizopora paradoxa]|uniref:F-box domain-containing protein n=1 Tax=Schizopora paradoxa TaxID=27342 RepID=A0A0H2S2T2_9AGAM|nr:hypothetical protein SCHPADRAFT_936449 [Schizopora paradoxa]
MAKRDNPITNDTKDKEVILAMVSSWLDREEAMPANWREEIRIFELVSDVDMGHDPSLRARVRGFAHRLSHALKTLNGLTVALEEEIKSFGAVTSKCGVSMLPDEVLTMILELVVEFVPRKGYKPSYKWKAAVTLSHVNRHFRAVMLGCPQFWTQMNTSPGMVTACLPRTNGLPLSVYLNVNQNTQTNVCSIGPIFFKLLPLSERWESLYLEFERSDGDEDDFTRMPQHTINAPLLDKLIIDYRDFEGGRPRRSRWDWALWNTPNLRVLQAIHHFPLSLPGLSNVVSLIIQFQANEDFFPEILEKISGMECLEYFTLKISNVQRPGGRLLVPKKAYDFRAFGV